MNLVVVSGHLSSEPNVRELQSGTVITTFELTTRVGDASVSVPLVWFEPPAALAVHAGDEVAVVGTVRRRFFRSAGITQSRTEVVVHHLGPAADKRTRTVQRKWIAGVLGAEVVQGLASL